MEIFYQLASDLLDEILVALQQCLQLRGVSPKAMCVIMTVFSYSMSTGIKNCFESGD